MHHAEQWLPLPIATVFDFFADPANLPRLMPAWQKARIDDSAFVAPPPRPGSENPVTKRATSVAAGQGTRMTISFRPVPLVPLRLPWDAEITEFVWDDHFCDIQKQRGPFAFWRHCHRLEARPRDGSPGTLLLDQVEYELPFGPLGDLANALFVRRQMDSIFSYRQKRTAELLSQIRPRSATA
jgi:ligand-binding SRPBCC domain-containing protein